jgi:hypothetical protein
MATGPQHRHDTRHVGLVPANQLASGTPSTGMVPTYSGTLGVAWGFAAAGSVPLTALANQATATMVGRVAAGSGPPSALSASDARSAMGLALASARSVQATGTAYTTSSASWADMDATNLSLTIVTGAHRVLVGFVAEGYSDTVGGYVMLDITVDGTRQGAPNYGLFYTRQGSAGLSTNLSFSYLTDILTAASHTFRLQFRTFAGTTATIIRNDPGCAFWVTEQPS